MASESGVFRHVYGAVQHILIKVGSEARSDIINELSTDIDEAELMASRDEIFKVARDVFNERNGIVAELELKARKGKNACISMAGDAHDLYSYVTFIDSTFPRDSLKQNSKLLEIENTDQASKANISTTKTNSEERSPINDAYIVLLRNEVSDLRKEVRELKTRLDESISLNEQDRNMWSSKFEKVMSQLAVSGFFDNQNVSNRIRVVDNQLSVSCATVNNTPKNPTLPSQLVNATTNSSVGLKTPSFTVIDKDQVISGALQLNASARNALPEVTVSSGAGHTPVTIAQFPGIVNAEPPAQSSGAVHTPVTRESSSRQPATLTLPTSSQAVTETGATVRDDDASAATAASDGPPLFSQVIAAPGDWNFKARRRQTHPNKNDNPNIQNHNNAFRGVKLENGSMIYLQNVYVDLHDSVSDIKDKVRRYATHKGLYV